jgi:PKHD-type hydroxylase
MEYQFEFGPYVRTLGQTGFNDFYVKKNVFTEDMVNNLTNHVENNYPFEKGRTGNQTSDMPKEILYETNNRDIAYLRPTSDLQWVYELLWDTVLEANQEKFKFDIDYVTDALHYVIYPENGGHLSWHMDIGNGINNRKLATTVQLSESNDYTGGEFQVWNGGDPNKGFKTLPRDKGDVIVFPVWLMHRVSPIINGQRKVLVFWTGGKSFR